MTVYSKYNMIYRLQKWLDSVPGQTFMNYAYSWGASIVILGTLFKLTHMPGANFMLYLGMGTEVIVFFISAFDRPFDKTSIGKELPTHVEADTDGQNSEQQEIQETMDAEVSDVQQNAPAGITIIGGGGYVSAPSSAQESAPLSLEQDKENVTIQSATPTQGGTVICPSAPQISPVDVQSSTTEEMQKATTDYIEELNNLTEVLSKVAEQSERLTRDSEEMENLNRTLTGICKVYEMQLKGASAQVGTIDEINEQTRRMAGQIAELNRIYSRMIEAMTVNMNINKIKDSLQ